MREVLKNGNYVRSTSVAILLGLIIFYAAFSGHRTRAQEECLVPCNEIIQGQVKDGIPSIDNPIYIDSTNTITINGSDKIVGIVIDGQPFAYPLDIFNWHEIVNDVYNGTSFSVTYAPLTGSAILYKTDQLNNSEIGTSGFLYENNLVFYDRITDSEWSQMLSQSLRGILISTIIQNSPTVETTWASWKQMYPETLSLTRDTGVIRDYDRYPYGNYQSDRSIYFPTSFNPSIEPYNLHHEKSRTQVLKLNNSTLLLPFEDLDKNNVTNYDFQNYNLTTFHDGINELAITYSSVVGNEVLNFSSYKNDSIDISLSLNLPMFRDNNGSVWNFKGEAILGPNTGSKLSQMTTYNAYWFAATTVNKNFSVFQSKINGSTDITSVITSIPTTSTSSTLSTTTSTETGTTVTSFLNQTPSDPSTEILSSSTIQTINTETTTVTITSERKSSSSPTIPQDKGSTIELGSFTNIVIPIFAILIYARVQKNQN